MKPLTHIYLNLYIKSGLLKRRIWSSWFTNNESFSHCARHVGCHLRLNEKEKKRKIAFSILLRFSLCVLCSPVVCCLGPLSFSLFGTGPTKFVSHCTHCDFWQSCYCFSCFITSDCCCMASLNSLICHYLFITLFLIIQVSWKIITTNHSQLAKA